ncbi:hypothetical protein PS947_05273 [Pseudomonas fluorescens]|nr:hypothetical protein PS947_05273 [Pseudomonas fluorescens]
MVLASEYIWWEKTVEYKFLLDLTRTEGLDFATPLSGIEEKAGDGIFAKDEKIVLVEFKRSSAELASEKKKFSSFSNALTQMEGKDAHHLLIYGSMSDTADSLALNAQTYFSGDVLADPLKLFDRGVSEEVFREYLKQFFKLKRLDDRSTDTSTSTSVKAVLGLSARGGESISLVEYLRISLPEIYRDLKKAKTLEFKI